MKKVYIIGAGDSGLGFENRLYESDAEIWAVNNMFVKYPKVPWTRVFEVHNFSLKPPSTWLRKGQELFRDLPINTYVEQLNKSGLPIYILDHPENPFTNSIIIPLEELLLEFRDFFSTTLSYEMALAIREGFTDIELIGIDMVVKAEYRDQRPSVAYFVGLAEGKGINVILPENSPLVKNDYRYGLGVSKYTIWHQRMASMKSHINQQITEKQSLLDQYKGALNCIDNVEEFFTILIQSQGGFGL